MATIHLVLGPVGAGKSTYARCLCEEHAAMMFNLDQWMAQLFRPDRPDEGVMAWYVERTQRCIEQIWRLTASSLHVGTNVVLEIGLIQRRERERLYRRVEAAGYAMVVHVLDAPRDERRERVERRNDEQGETFSMVVPPDIFEMASDLWEPPDDDERARFDVRFVDNRGPLSV